MNNEKLEVYIKRAESLISSGAYENAVIVLNKVLKIDPKNMDALDYKGNALSRLGRFQEVIEVCDEILKIDPMNAVVLNNRRNILKKLNQSQETTKVSDEVSIKERLTKNLFNFEGRIGRLNYFCILLFLAITTIIIESINPNSVPGSILAVVIFIGCIWINVCAVVKRFHDLDMSGANCWRLFIPIYHIIIGFRLLFRKGTIGANIYGDDPLVGGNVSFEQVEKMMPRPVQTYEKRTDTIVERGNVKYCRHCGTKHPEDAMFCSSCGKPF